MAKKRYSAEQIVAKLRAAEVELSQGQTTTQVCKKLGLQPGVFLLEPTRLWTSRS